MTELISNSPEDTSALGRQFAAEAGPGWVIGLTGDLGVGKTQLVKGLALGLGINDRVQSPTFALVHQYNKARIPLVHIDLYRLDTPSQIIGAGLDQFLYDPTIIVVVEWIERWFGAEPPSLAAGALYRHVRIEQISPTSRRIVYADTRA